MKIRKILFISTCIISILGILMIYSASSIWSLYKFNDQFHYLKYQIIFFIIGLVLINIISKININDLEKHSNTILFITIILLILVLIPGIGSIRNGSRSWFGIGPLGIQPSELSKISLIIFTSKYLSRNEKYINNFIIGVLPILLVLGIIFGLIMLQPDLGTAFIIAISIISLLFISGVDKKFFITCFIIGTISLIVLIIIAPYRMNRITSFINPWKDPLGTGFQMIQSLFAIAPGGLLGLGYGNSIQKHFYLPEPQTDFIFSIITEELGIGGVLLVIGLFIVILTSCIKISLNTKTLFSRYLSFGITFQLIIQSILNLSVVVGLIPITGVTLPFISYGGSSLLVSMASIGIILSISKLNS